MHYEEPEIREMDELLEDFIRALVSEPDEVEIDLTHLSFSVLQPSGDGPTLFFARKAK